MIQRCYVKEVIKEGRLTTASVISTSGSDPRVIDADSRQQTEDSRQQTADNRQQTADSTGITTASVMSTSGSDPRVIEAKPSAFEPVYWLSDGCFAVWWLS